LPPSDRIAIPGAEICGKLLTAEAVGGDYYDILPCNDGAWLAIGDVAEHGLHAGLIMMMLQSTVSSVVGEKQDGSPSQLLERINAVMYDNIRNRMARNEYVTFTLLRYSSNGCVTFAGAHEDIIVLSNGNAHCERIKTPGTWLGAIDSVDGHMTDQT